MQRLPPYRDITKVLHNHNFGFIVLVSLSILVSVTILGDGWDFYRYYRPNTLNGTYGQGTWLPYYGYWLVAPFAALPPHVGYLAWNIANGIALGLACRSWRVNPLPLALSFPVLVMFRQGQIEGIIALGAALSLAPNLILAGLGLTLLSIKPQIGILLAGYVLLTRRNWRLLLVPILVFGASLLYWGWWPPEWVDSLPTNDPEVVGGEQNISLYPYSLLLIPLIWFFRKSAAQLLRLTPLLAPYFAFYSLAVVFSAGLPLWVNLVAWFIGIFYIGNPAAAWWLVPVGLILNEYRHLLVKNLKLRRGVQTESSD